MSETPDTFEDQLLAYVEGRLPADRARAVQAKLAQDPRLAATVEGMVADRLGLRQMPLAPAPPNLTQQIMEQVERGTLLGSAERDAFIPKSPWWQNRWVIAASLLLLCGAFGVLVFHAVWSPPGAPVSVAMTQPVLPAVADSGKPEPAAAVANGRTEDGTPSTAATMPGRVLASASNARQSPAADDEPSAKRAGTQPQSPAQLTLYAEPADAERLNQALAELAAADRPRDRRQVENVAGPYATINQQMTQQSMGQAQQVMRNGNQESQQYANNGQALDNANGTREQTNLQWQGAEAKALPAGAAPAASSAPTAQTAPSFRAQKDVRDAETASQTARTLRAVLRGDQVAALSKTFHLRSTPNAAPTAASVGPAIDPSKTYWCVIELESPAAQPPAMSRP